MSVWKKVAAAAGAGETTGSYIAVASRSSPYFTLLDHTTPGSLSLATTFNVGAQSFDTDFTPDGNYIAVAELSQVTLLDHTTPGSVSLATTYNTGPNGLNFSYDGNYLVCSVNISGVVLLDHTTPGSLSLAATYATVIVSGAPRPTAVAFSPDDNYIAATSLSFSGPTIFTLIDHTTPGSMSLAATYSMVGGGAESVCFTPDGNYIVVPATDFNGTVTLIDHTTPGSMSLAATYITNKYYLRGVASDPTGDYIAVVNGGSSGATDNLILLDHTTPGSLSLATTYNAAGSLSVDFSPDGKYLVFGRTNGIVTLLDHTTPGSLSLVTTYTCAGDLEGIKFSPN